MSVEFEQPLSSLRAVMRPLPVLSPEDSISRFIRICRLNACSSLPVLCQTRVCGMVYQKDVLALLSRENATDNDSILHRPLSDIMRPQLSIRSDSSLQNVRKYFIDQQLDLLHALPVVDDQNYCLGIIIHNDLLLSDAPTCRPGSIGGMATPFGVYLTDGTLQAGASNLALVTSGAVTGGLLLLAVTAVDFCLKSLSRFGHGFHSIASLDVATIGSNVSLTVALLGFAVKLTIYLLFFALLRATSIAGYHAAEHQTVHAMERNEPLVIDVVRRMPRPHPRCGTNIMGIGLLLFTLYPLLVSLLHLEVEDAFFVAAAITFFSWRGFGNFLQAVFTTRPASDKQIASGIAAGETLIKTFYNAKPVRSVLLRRIWCMGIFQNMIGLLLVMGSAQLLTWFIGRFNHNW